MGLLLACAWTWCWWKPDVVHSLAPHTHTQANQRQPQTVDCCAAPNRWPRAGHGQCLTLILTRLPPRGPITNTPSGGIQTISEHNPINSTSSTPQGRSQQAPDSAGTTTLHGVSPHTAAYILWSGSTLTVSQPENQSHSWKGEQQL